MRSIPDRIGRWTERGSASSRARCFRTKAATQAELLYTLVAHHETIHLAASQGTYSDTDLARAAVDLGGLSDDLKDEFARIDPNSADAHRAYSRFWNRVLKQHCP